MESGALEPRRDIPKHLFRSRLQPLNTGKMSLDVSPSVTVFVESRQPLGHNLGHNSATKLPVAFPRRLLLFRTSFPTHAPSEHCTGRRAGVRRRQVTASRFMFVQVAMADTIASCRAKIDRAREVIGSECATALRAVDGIAAPVQSTLQIQAMDSGSAGALTARVSQRPETPASLCGSR